MSRKSKYHPMSHAPKHKQLGSVYAPLSHMGPSIPPFVVSVPLDIWVMIRIRARNRAMGMARLGSVRFSRVRTQSPKPLTAVRSQ